MSVLRPRTAPRWRTWASRSRVPAPVFDGDTFHAESEVVGGRESKSRPDAGDRHLRASRPQPTRRARVPSPPERLDVTTAGLTPEIGRLPRACLFSPAVGPTSSPSCRGTIPTAWSSTSRMRSPPSQGPRATARHAWGPSPRPRIRHSRCTSALKRRSRRSGSRRHRRGLHAGARRHRRPEIETSEEVDLVDAPCATPASSTYTLSWEWRPRAVSTRCREFPRPPVAACYFGAEDFIADMGGVRTESSTEVLYARSRSPGGADRGRARPRPVASCSARRRVLADAASVTRSATAASSASTRRRCRSPIAPSRPPPRRSSAPSVSWPPSPRRPPGARQPSPSRAR